MPAPPHVVFALVGDVRGSSRAVKQLRWLAGLGARVTALTLGPPSEDRPSGERVTLRVLPRPDRRGPEFFWRCHRLFLREALCLPAAAYHASDLYTLPALAAAARRHGGALALDARELYPHVDGTAGKPWATWAWTAVERAYLRRCDAVFAVNRSIAERMARTYRIPEPLLVHNLPVRRAVERTDALRERLGIPGDQPIVLYQGLIREGRGLETLVRAMRGVPEAALVTIGDGPLKPALERQAADALGRRAHFLPHTPPDELLALTASADLGVFVAEPITESVRLALPNKLFEYLAAGLPLVVTALPEVERVVRGFDVGLVVPPGDAAALAAALRHALTDEAARARWHANAPRVFEAFDPERDRARFEAAYRRLLRIA